MEIIFFDFLWVGLQRATDTTYAHLELVQDVSECAFDALSCNLQSVACGGPGLRPHPRSPHHV